MPSVEVEDPYDEVEAELDFGARRPGSPAIGRGECPVCGLRVSVRASGRLWHHGPNNQHRCPGSGAEPRGGVVPPEGGE